VSGGFFSNGLAVATGLTAAAILVIGLIILVRGRGLSNTGLFFTFTFAVAGWMYCFTRMYAAPDADTALWWARAGYLVASFLPAASFEFVADHFGRRRKPLRAVSPVLWVLFGALGVIAATTSFFIPRVIRYDWGFYPAANSRTMVLVAFYAAAVIAAMLLLLSAYRRSEGKARERAGTLLLAFVLGSFAAADFLPSLGYDTYPVGYMAVLALVIVAASALWSEQLIDLTPEYASSQILATMKNAVIVLDLDGRIRVVNSAACIMLGYTSNDLVGVHVRKILDVDEHTSTKRLLNSSGVLEQNLVWRTAEGNRLDVLASSSIVRDDDGVPVGVVYVAADYTERKKAEVALRESEHRYRMLFDSNPIPMWVYDFETLRFIAVNDAAVRHYGYSREEFLTLKIIDIRPADEIPAVLDLLPKLPPSVGPSMFRHMKKDGTIIDVDVSSFEFTSGGRRVRLVIANDVTEQKRAEAMLRESESRYRLLFERNLAGVFRSTPEGRFLDCNEACARMFGYDTREEFIQQPAASVYFERSERDRIMELLREQKSISNYEIRLRKKDGTALWVLGNMNLLEEAQGGAPVIEGTIIDITDRKYAQEQIEYQAYHDALTGLPNRLLFRDRITIALAHARRTNRTVAVMFLDLDDFKTVNDTLGHTIGDRLLQATAVRLVNSVRAEDTVARMGGDEFTVLLADVGDGRGASTVARKILDAIHHPVNIDGHELTITTSIGLALFPGDGFDAEALLRNADRAMYRAKQLGRNNYQYATPPPFDDRYTLERRLKQALDRDEFVLHYQPIVEITTNRLVGAEALLRWNDPIRGILHPDLFVSAAEESDLVYDIGEWVLRNACGQMKHWHDLGHPKLRISVNLSARQFQQRDLPAIIARILREAGLGAEFLDLEITESTAMGNPDLSLVTMRALKEMGVRISIDDFGTGHSSLSYLKRFPIDTVKIDQEFVRDLTGDPNDRAIITAVVSMARALRLRVIAEGVETQEQLTFLQNEQCAEMQGFLYSKPVPPADFEKGLKQMPDDLGAGFTRANAT
jgi:diguanylate cyclase (GGDEF)-like protein/PAS domain S-box-containing protein